MEAAAVAGDREALTAADEAFHRTLIRLSDHDLLLTLWNSLYLRIHQIMALRNTSQPNLAEIAANHAPIVRAIEAGDAEQAVRLISEHTRSLADLDPASIAGSTHERRVPRPGHRAGRLRRQPSRGGIRRDWGTR